MKNKIIKVLVAVFFQVGITNISSAAVYSYDFTAVVTNGTYAGETGAGSFTYDTAFYSAGEPIWAGSGGLSVTLNLFGQSFTHENDVDYIIMGSPTVQFVDSATLDQPIKLDFAVSEGCYSGMICDPDRVITSIDREGVLGFEGKPLTFNAATNSYYWDVTVFEAVPLPAAVWLFGSGLIGLIGLARRKTHALY